MASNQDFDLLVGVAGGGAVSGESGKLIQSQLDSIFANLKTDKFVIKVKSVDASEAIKTLKAQIQNELNAVTANTTTTASGTTKVASSRKTSTTTTANTAAKDKQAVSKVTEEYKRQLAEIEGIRKAANSLNLSLNKLGKTDIGEGELKDINRQYADWKVKVDELRASKKALNAESEGSFDALKTEGRDLVSSMDAAKKSVADMRNQLKELDKLQSQADKFYDPIRSYTPPKGSKDPLASGLSGVQKEYQKVTDAINGAREKAGRLDDTEFSKIRANLDKLTSKAKSFAAEAGISSRVLDNEAVSLREVVSLRKQLDTYLRKNTSAVDTAQYKELTRLRDVLLGVENNSVNASDGLAAMNRASFSNIRGEATALQSQLRSLGQEGRSLGNIIVNAFQRFGGWTLVTKSLTTTIHQFREMLDVVKDIDSAMTELRKVTDETSITYANFLDNAIVRAKEYGATVADTVNATADFARLGYDMDLASDMADAAIVYKNVGDGIEDIGTASESIISTMQAFNDETLTAMSVVDRFNEVDNKFAITALGVGEALTRSAAAMSAANNTLDQSIALITAANTVVQNPEHVGTTCMPSGIVICRRVDSYIG